MAQMRHSMSKTTHLHTMLSRWILSNNDALMDQRQKPLSTTAISINTIDSPLLTSRAAPHHRSSPPTTALMTILTTHVIHSAMKILHHRQSCPDSATTHAPLLTMMSWVSLPMGQQSVALALRNFRLLFASIIFVFLFIRYLMSVTRLL